DASARGVDVLVLEARDDFVDVDAEPRELLLVDRDVDLVLEAAADLDRGDARHGLDALLEIVVGEAAQLLELDLADRSRRAGGLGRRRRRGAARGRRVLAGAAVGRQPEPEDRIGR